MTTTEADIQRLRGEGRNFKLVEGPFGDRYVNTETSEVVITEEQKTEGRRRQSEWASSQGFAPPPPQEQPQENNQATIDSEQQQGSTGTNPDPSKLTKEEKTFRQISPQTTPPTPSKPPGFGMTRPTITDSLLSQGKKDLIDNYPREAAQRNSGFFNTEITEPVPTYNSTNAEKVVQGKTNTYIILGRDRPASEYSGKGATPNTHTGCIDIIAGMSGILAREVDNKGDKIVTNKNPHLDAARIYISQRSDIDSPEYFNLAKGKVGNPTNRSAIAIKADSVRIIGREGIKLVTSTDTYNGGAGMFVGDNIQGIDLIAGNDDSDLQPMVKGDDLAKILDDLVEIISSVQDTVSFNLEAIINIISVVISATAGATSGGFSSTLSRLPMEIFNLQLQEMNFAFHKLNYSDKNPFAKYNFRSKYNNVN